MNIVKKIRNTSAKYWNLAKKEATAIALHASDKQNGGVVYVLEIAAVALVVLAIIALITKFDFTALWTQIETAFSKAIGKGTNNFS